MTTEYVKVDGPRDFQRDLKQADKALASEFRKVLKGAAILVANQAREIAASEGLRDSGHLIGSIKAGLQGGDAVVRVTAERHGFRYPAVYEYGRRSPWQQSKGVRQFLAPALEKELVVIEAETLKAIDRIMSGLARNTT